MEILILGGTGLLGQALQNEIKMRWLSRKFEAYLVVAEQAKKKRGGRA